MRVSDPLEPPAEQVHHRTIPLIYYPVEIKMFVFTLFTVWAHIWINVDLLDLMTRFNTKSSHRDQGKK